MAVYRLYDPNPAYVNLLGTESAPGGTLTTYDLGTTTPKTTYADYAKSVPNANPVELDSSGRADTEIWLDGDYTIVLKDADDTTIWTRDVRPEVAPGLALPDPVGHDGEVVVASGSGFVLEDRLQLPDPTGSASYMLVVNSDGTDYILQAQPEPEEIEVPDPEVTIDGTNKTFTASASTLDDKFVIQVVTGSIAANNEKSMSGAVVFDTAFTALWAVHVQVRASIVSGGDTGRLPATGTTGWTPGSPATGANIHFELTEDDPSPANRFTSAVPYVVTAIGTIAKE